MNRIWTNGLWRGGILAVTLSLVLGHSPARAQVQKLLTLEEALLRQAPQILRYLKDQGCRNVGVLKFRVKKGQEPVTDNAGPVNLTLADRLELALVLRERGPQPIGIVRSGSTVAAKLKGANHLNEPGRKKLFQARYPLAWGKEEVTPDVFLTGVAQFSLDLRQMTVGILAFKESGPLKKVVEFTAGADPASLIEAGESFVLRGVSVESKLLPPQVIDASFKVRSKVEVHPLADTEAPICLEVYYDGQLIPLEIRAGQAWISEPAEGQEVKLVLRRTARAQGTYGAVVKVNGENTINRQRRPDLLCLKWVLEAGDEPMAILGFQEVEGSKAEKFRVLSREESLKNEMNYGSDLGTISLVVFRERKGGDRPPLDLREEGEDLEALQRGVFPQERPQNLAALQEQLRRPQWETDDSRGIIKPGNKIDSKVQIVKINWDPTPVMSATVVYYRPQKGGPK